MFSKLPLKPNILSLLIFGTKQLGFKCFGKHKHNNNVRLFLEH